MFNFRRLSIRGVLVISGLFVITLVVLTDYGKVSRKVNTITETVNVTARTIKFRVKPSLVVRAGDNPPTKPLQAIRRPVASGPLRVNPANPRYFTDGSGRAVYLTGAHTWSNLQDNGFTDPPPVFDYQKYLSFLEAYNHNFIRLWSWEEAKWSTDTAKDYWYDPMPYQRLGKERALDGKPKFDLTRFNQAYFDRIRRRVVEAGQRGIYVSIMLFNGFSIEDKRVEASPPRRTPGNPWQGHPYNRDNNVNGIDGDPDKSGRGEKIHTLRIPAVTRLQEQYVRKVIDTVNDLDNVLFEISNESPVGSRDWQYHMVAFIKSYEAGKPKQHPVGMTVEYPFGDNSLLFAGPADWVSPNGSIDNPPVADGNKVILADTDHLCGICGDHRWVWKSFTRGENPLFMDVYDGAYFLSEPPIPPDPLHYEPWVRIRRNLGYALTYANRMNLAAMTPRSDLASTGYCLADPVERGAEYLIYLPSGGTAVVDLSAAKGELSVEWLNPGNGLTISGIKTNGGGNRSFIAPFKGDAVLFIEGS